MTELDPAVVAKLPITQDWTVVAFKEGKTEDNPRGPGQLTKFYVDFIGADETEVPDVYWRRKAGNAPELNKPVFGTMMQGNYGPMFKMEKRDGSTYQPQPSPGQQQVVPTQPDDRQRHIERQSARRDAIGFAQVMATAGRLPENFNREDLHSLILWMEAEVTELDR